MLIFSSYMPFFSLPTSLFHLTHLRCLKNEWPFSLAGRSSSFREVDSYDGQDMELRAPGLDLILSSGSRLIQKGVISIVCVSVSFSRLFVYLLFFKLLLPLLCNVRQGDMRAWGSFSMVNGTKGVWYVGEHLAGGWAGDGKRTGCGLGVLYRVVEGVGC